MGSGSVRVLLNGRGVATVPFDKPVQRLGRMKENDVVIDNVAVSRFHATLAWDGDDMVLEDQNSENGCIVNGERQARAVVGPGDEIFLGKHQLVIDWQGAGPPPLVTPEREPPVEAHSDAWDANATYCVSAGSPKPPEPVYEDEEPKPEARPEAPVLVVKVHGDVERVIRWDQASLSLGRARDCDLVVDDPGVSRHHATLQRDGESYEIHDLATPNGTIVNGAPVLRHPLRSGDVIGAGAYQIVFRMPGDDEASLDERCARLDEHTVAPLHGARETDVMADPGSTTPLTSPSFSIVRPFGDGSESDRESSGVFGAGDKLTLQIEIASSELTPELRALLDALTDSDLELPAVLTIKRR